MTTNPTSPSDLLGDTFDRIARTLGADLTSRTGLELEPSQGTRRTRLVDPSPSPFAPVGLPSPAELLAGGMPSPDWVARLLASQVGAHTRPVGSLTLPHLGQQVTLWLRWATCQPDTVGLAWVEASWADTFGRWDLCERTDYLPAATVLPSVGLTLADLPSQVDPDHTAARAAVARLVDLLPRRAAHHARRTAEGVDCSARLGAFCPYCETGR